MISWKCAAKTVTLQKLFSMAIQKNKKTSIKDIAREVGVSPALVSFVLNGKQKQYRVSDEMAEKILEAVKRLDYKPNGFAKALREGSSHTIGVIVSDISNPFFSNMVKSIETVAEEQGYMALFASSDEKSDKLSSLIDRMLGKEVEGLIVVPCEGSETIIRKLDRKRIPYVLLDRHIPEIRSNYVCLDNVKAGYEATEWLLRNGHKKIALVCYDLELSNMKGRLEGYRKAMEDNGVGEYVHIEYADIEKMDRSCDSAIDKIAAEGCEAIVCATNSITVSCLRAIQKRGIKVPDEICIMGFDGGNEFDFYNAPLAFMTQPGEMIARRAVEILVNNLTPGDFMTYQIEAEGSISIYNPLNTNALEGGKSGVKKNYIKTKSL